MKSKYAAMSRCCLFFLLLARLAQAQQLELIVPGQNLFVNSIAAQQHQFPHLNGKGIVISIKEFGFDTSDVDLKGRVRYTPNAATNLSIHANIMASLAGGAGNSDPAGRGVAPGSILVSSSFVGLEPDPDYRTPHISVQNHSYGIDIQNWYGSGALAYDQSSWDNRQLLHIFSAGNKGDSTAQTGPYAMIPGYANLTGSFKMAKNVLVVGAVDSLGHLNPFSSRGPAFDGRIKPDLVAFGYDGSSGAAALVSGAAAVVQQALQEQADTLPNADLVRAILLNSADDIAAPGPDFESGFGNLNLKNAVENVVARQYATGALSAGQTLTWPIEVPEQLRRLKVTLCWNEPPAPLLAPKSLLNDLDLRLISPGGLEMLPWALNSFPHPDSLRLPAHQGNDTLNNVEQITVNFPASGLWEAQIKAPAQLNNAQSFGLSWRWDSIAQVEWTYPLQNDPAPALQEVILRWESSDEDNVARLEWRDVQSPEWQLLRDSVHIDLEQLRWALPDTFAEAQLRWLVGGKEFRSDTFLISKALRMNVGFNCPDSLYLFWNQANPNAMYQLYGLGDQYLEPLHIVSDTFVVLQKSAYPSPRFAVAPMAAGQHALGPRSSAPEISSQGVRCYFLNFLAELNDQNQADLSLSIGTNYHLSSILFEKKAGTDFVVLNEQTAGQLAFEFVDENLQEGANIYRVSIRTDQGILLHGDTSTVYFVAEGNWRVFPNPALSNGALTVASRSDGDVAFSLFDVLGRPVAKIPLYEQGERLVLNGILPGIYLYKITNGAVFVGEGKLVIK